MKLNIEWTDDCQGKKDYDAGILSVSTRYWPRGGGFHILDNSKPTWEQAWRGNETRPEIKPSAHSSILLNCDYDDDDRQTLVEKKFEADTEVEVKAQVEAWVNSQYIRILNCLKGLYPIKEASDAS